MKLLGQQTQVKDSMALYQEFLCRVGYHFFNGYALPPLNIDLEPTYRCNLRCDMCMLWGQSGILKTKKTRKELSLQEIKKFIDEVRTYPFFNSTFVLAGGEPFARKDTIQIIEHLHLRGFKYHIVTNGSLLNERIIKEIIRVHPTKMTFSIDGPEQIHDRIRGVKGTFNRAVSAIKRIKEQDEEHAILMEIQCTISGINIPYLEKMVELAKELDVSLRYQHLMFLNEKRVEEQNEFNRKYFNIEHDMFFNGLLNDLQDFDVQGLVEKIKEVKRMALKLNVKLSFNPNLALHEIPRYYLDLDNYTHSDRCLYPWSFVRVNPYGDVCPCAEYHVGNIRDSGFKSIYNNEKMRYFRRTLKEKRLFPGCVRCCFL